jgi:hypothetical protein
MPCMPSPNAQQEVGGDSEILFTGAQIFKNKLSKKENNELPLEFTAHHVFKDL